MKLRYVRYIAYCILTVLLVVSVIALIPAGLFCFLAVVAVSWQHVFVFMNLVQISIQDWETRTWFQRLLKSVFLRRGS